MAKRWSHHPGERHRADRDLAPRAKAVCSGCPVKEACLAYALKTRQPWGVWGGMTAHERGTAYGQQWASQAG